MQLGTRIAMAKGVRGCTRGIPALDTGSRISPLDAGADDVRVWGCGGGKGAYGQDRRGRGIEIVEIEVVLTLSERQLRGVKVREHVTPGDARVVFNILEIAACPPFGRCERCERI